MKKKRVWFLVGGFLLVLGLLAFFGERGLLHLMRLRKELSKIRQDNQEIALENERLKEEVRRLKVEKSYIEEIARKELGMVKEGEVVYQFDRPQEERK